MLHYSEQYLATAAQNGSITFTENMNLIRVSGQIVFPSSVVNATVTFTDHFGNTKSIANIVAPTSLSFQMLDCVKIAFSDTGTYNVQITYKIITFDTEKEWFDTAGYSNIDYAPNQVQTTANAQFGNGTDGSVIFDGTTTFTFATLSGGNYTLTRDVQGTNITVNSGVIVYTGNYRILATNQITNNGTISADGLGGTGGASVAGTTGIAAGNNGSKGTAPNGVLLGGGGGSGAAYAASGSTSSSGAGGNGGGLVWIASPVIFNNGTFTAKGSVGSNASGSGGTPTYEAAGGGGGGGGYMMLIYSTQLEKGVTSVVSGGAGSGANAGASPAGSANGGSGANGYGAGGVGGDSANTWVGQAGTAGDSGGAGGAGGISGGTVGTSGSGGNGAVQTLLV